MINTSRAQINWGAVALRGVAALIFGMCAIAMPGLTLAALVFLFGAYAILDGLFALGAVFREQAGTGHWWALLIGGIAGIVAGVLTFGWPGITAIVLLVLIGARALITGIMEVVAAIRLRDTVSGIWGLGLAGVASVLFGAGVMVYPLAGALALAWVIGVYAMAFGVLMIAAAYQMRRTQIGPARVEVTRTRTSTRERVTPGK